MKIYLLYSFFVHTVILTCLLSLPIYMSSINLRSFVGYFVYLKNEEGKTVVKPPLAYKIKVSETRLQRGAGDSNTVLKTEEVDAKENTKQLEAEKAASGKVEPLVVENAFKEEVPSVNGKENKMAKTEEESRFKTKETVGEKMVQAVENKEPLEPSGVEKTLKEEAPAVNVKEMEITKKEVHEDEKLEAKGATVKASPLTEKFEEAVKPPSSPVLPETDTGRFPEAKLDNGLVTSEEGRKEEIVQVEKTEKKALKERELKHEMKVSTNEKIAPAVHVKGPSELSGVKKALKGKTSTMVQAQVIEVAKEITVKASPLIRGTKEDVKPQVGGKPDRGVSDASVSPLEEKASVLEKVSSEVKEEPRIEEKKPSLGIPISETLLLRDVKIEVFLKRFSSEIPAPAESEHRQLPRATEITNISYKKSADIVEIQVKGNGSMTLNVFPSDNRIVIDIPDVVLNATLPSAVVSPLKGIRSGKHKDKVRLVLDLKEKMDFGVLSVGDSIVVTVQKLKKEPSLSPMGHKPPEKNEAIGIKRKNENIGINDQEMSSILLHLLKKAYPTANGKNASKKQKEAYFIEGREETYSTGTLGVKKLFSVAKAEKGSYIFIIKNNGKKAYEADVVFHLFEGKTGERIKEFKDAELSPNGILQFKFILPEAIFWDDEYYFTGTIEDSNTLTKFNDKTGLIWKEKKDY